MSDEIKPALTPRQWQYEEVQDEDGDRMFGISEHGDLRVYPGYRDWFEGQERHALAALALHSTPQGFTWEDVDAVREALRDLSGWEQETADRLRTLATRIESLLPPRNP
jgi:hypothetical protein